MGVSIPGNSPVPDGVSLENYSGAWRYKKKIFIASSTFTGDTTKTINLSGSYAYFVIEGKLRHSAGANLSLRINGLSTNIYNYQSLVGVAVTRNVFQSQIVLCNCPTDDIPIKIIIPNVTKDGGYLEGVCIIGSNTGDPHCVSFDVDLGANTNVTSVTLFTPSGTLSNTIHAYGVLVGGL